MNNFSKKQLREFGFVIGFGFPLMIGFIIPFINGHNFQSWTLFIGIPCLALGIIRPTTLYYLYKFWLSLGNALGWVNSKLILGLVYLLILQPISYLMRLFGYDPLRKKIIVKDTYREINSKRKIDLKKNF